jgi:hypothetical protein
MSAILVRARSAPSPSLFDRATRMVRRLVPTGYALDLRSKEFEGGRDRRKAAVHGLEHFADLLDQAVDHVARRPDASIRIENLEWRLHFENRDGYDSHVRVVRWGDMALLQVGASGWWIDLHDAEHVGVDVPVHTEIDRLPAWADRLRHLARVVDDPSAPKLLADCRAQLGRFAATAAATAGCMDRDKAVVTAATRHGRRATSDLEERSDGIDMTVEFDRAGETWIPGFQVDVERSNGAHRLDLTIRPCDIKCDAITDPLEILRILGEKT